VIARPVLSTPRLVLRPRQPEDADAVFVAVQDPELVRWLPNWAGATTADAVANCARGESATAVDLAITAGGAFVGHCWLAKLDRSNRTSSSGYWLAPQARGSGYAAEALSALAGWGFAELGLERIHLHAAEGNVASQRTALRAGFRAEGRQRRACRCDGHQQDMLVFARLRDDPAGPAPRPLPDVDTLTDGVVAVRPMRTGDAAAWHAERIDPEAIRWSTTPDPPDLAETQRRATGVAARWLAGTEARFAIIEGGAYAGHISLRMTEPEIGIGEVGYALHPAFRGHGLMFRALRLVTHWALIEVGLARVEAGVGTTNAASLRTAEAAGFRREGILRQALPGAAGRYDIVVLSMLRSDLTPDPPGG